MEASLYYIAFPLLALVMTLALMPLVRRVALRAGFVDEPGGRKQHDEAVPPIGGLVVFSVFMILLSFIDADIGSVKAYYAALMLILVTGVIDDSRGVSALLKFLIHFTAAFLLVVPGGAQIETLGNILGMGEFRLGWASIPFSIACVVYIINAINMMDGLDGLAGGLGLIILIWLMAACGVSGRWDAFNELALLAGALVGFLYFNMRHPFRKRATVFLGDAGSMALGLTIAWFCIGLSQGDRPVIAPVSVAWVIALPIIDAFGLLVARLKEGKHPFHPDRRHFHHHFLNAGFTVGQSTARILFISACLGGIGFFGLTLGIPEGLLGWLWMALWIGHACLVMRPDPFVRLLVRLRGTQAGTGTRL
jgi:UDP-GlcNAc:undecaprenyl-phosphate GlcNAc-1-phosphate transferase